MVIGSAGGIAGPASVRRRAAAVLLSLVLPGAGHAAIGHPLRGLAWYGAFLCAVAGVWWAAFLAAPRLLSVFILLGSALAVLAALDTPRLPRPSTLPRGTLLGLVAVAAFVFLHIVPPAVLLWKSFEGFVIKGERSGMSPSLLVGDRVFVRKLPRFYGRGDVILMRHPSHPDLLRFMRIVAVAGDTVEVLDGRLVIDGRTITRRIPREPGPAAPEEAAGTWEEELGGRVYRVAIEENPARREWFRPLVVPEGHLFVLGDCRDASQDSRDWGSLPPDRAIGKAVFIWWSSGPEGVRWDRVYTRVR